MFCKNWHVACGILIPWPGIEPLHLALKLRVLTTREVSMHFNINHEIGIKSFIVTVIFLYIIFLFSENEISFRYSE